MVLRARHFATGKWTDLAVEGRKIAAMGPASGPDQVSEDDDWIAPAFWDIQTNGRWGISFADENLRPDQVAEIVRAQAGHGTARLCPTLITAPFESVRNGLAAIATACSADPEINARVVGIHVEGPYISEVDGYRGAHPREAVRDPDWSEFERLQDASGGRIVLMTLAPERPRAIAFIEKAVAAGLTIALGHTAADGATLRAAVSAGARLSTHLGNGIASPLARHPNPIWEQAGNDALSASFIADGHHLDLTTLRVLVRAKTPARVILVSDASPLAGLPPGTYGPWAVDPSGKIVVAGTPYLAGSNQGLEVGLNNLIRATGMGLSEAFATVTTNPARLLDWPMPGLGAGEPANLIVFRRVESPEPTIRLLRTCVDGTWSEVTPGTDPQGAGP
jgi:N-acetylglucosamine-6-phosphate deacetylase